MKNCPLLFLSGRPQYNVGPTARTVPNGEFPPKRDLSVHRKWGRKARLDESQMTNICYFGYFIVCCFAFFELTGTMRG